MINQHFQSPNIFNDLSTPGRLSNFATRKIVSRKNVVRKIAVRKMDETQFRPPIGGLGAMLPPHVRPWLGLFLFASLALFKIKSIQQKFRSQGNQIAYKHGGGNKCFSFLQIIWKANNFLLHAFLIKLTKHLPSSIHSKFTQKFLSTLFSLLEISPDLRHLFPLCI